MGIQDRDWYRHDRPRTESQYHYNPREFRGKGAGTAGDAPPGRSSALYLHMGLAAAVVLIWLLAELLAQRRAEAAAEERLRATQHARAQALQVEREAAERQARREAELQLRESLRSQSIARQQHLEYDRKRAAMAEADRREHAWSRFYRKPAVCDDAATVECANAYIRAKRAFEEKYARGEL